MIKKYITHSGITIEIGDFYGGGMDEVVSSFEEISLDVPTHIRINTNLSYYELPLSPGDYISYQDGSGKIIKNKHDESEHNE